MFFIPGADGAALAGDAGRAAAVLNDVNKVAEVAKLADVADTANAAGRLGGLRRTQERGASSVRMLRQEPSRARAVRVRDRRSQRPGNSNYWPVGAGAGSHSVQRGRQCGL
jgi:hypothetical protein